MPMCHVPCTHMCIHACTMCARVPTHAPVCAYVCCACLCICMSVQVCLCSYVCLCSRVCAPSSFTQIRAQCAHLGSEGSVPSKRLGTVRLVTEGGRTNTNSVVSELASLPGGRSSHLCELQTLSLEYLSQIHFWIKLSLFCRRTIALRGWSARP